MGVPTPTHRHLVSVKGVCVQGGRVLLLRNERDEWELPGGKLERGEDPQACLAREVAEESGWEVRVGPLLDAWQYPIFASVDVLVLTYGCEVVSDGPPVLSEEHKQIGLFALDDVSFLRMPEGYRRSIDTWWAARTPTTPARAG